MHSFLLPCQRLSVCREQGKDYSRQSKTPKTVFANVLGAQEIDSEESIPPGWESIPGSLKMFTNMDSKLSADGS